MGDSNDKKNSNTFSSKVGFIAAAAGSAIGLGNIWRFPYEVGENGGASFLFIYLICVILIGYPLVVAELAFGRRMQGGFLKAHRKLNCKIWKAMGAFTAICSIIVLSFYNVITGWTIGYFIEITSGNLLQIKDTAMFFTTFTKSIPHNLCYGLLALLPVTWIVKKGVQSGLERWSKLLMPLFLIMLIGLIIYAITLEGACKGLAFYLIPRFECITIDVVYKALGQAFLSLSVGLGILVTYGSYMNSKEYIPHTAILITLSDTVVSFLAGFFIFPFIYYKRMATSQGSALVFISLPLVFQALGPRIGTVVGSIFFLLFAFAAITSSMSLLEVITSYIVDRLRIKRAQAAYLSAALIYIISLPSILSMGGSTFFTNLFTYQGNVQSFFSFISSITINLAIPLSCLVFMSLFVYQCKTQKLFLEINRYSKNHRGSWLEKYIQITIRYVCPILLSFVLLMNILEAVFGIQLNMFFK
jgi:NSS family neurotransmitter:Na+ symporter